MTYAVPGIKGPVGVEVHLLIVGFDYDRKRAKFFRSATADRAGLGHGAEASISLAEAIHASTNAPVDYFDGPARFPRRPDRYWDGGITGCNNPVMVAVTEAVVLGQHPNDIVALSLGTGSVLLPVAGPGAPSSPYLTQRDRPGLGGDIKKLTMSILDDPPDAATFVAHVVTGDSAGVVTTCQLPP